ncbi:MAG: hypothetical protein Q9211_005885 [Gyalolechia sp. 1 TL-2023]
MFFICGCWVLWALLTADSSVFAASISNPFQITPQLAKSTNESILIEKLVPNPELQRLFEVAKPKLSSGKPSDDHLLAEDFSYYHIVVTGTDVTLDIQIDNTRRLPPLNFRRLLRETMITFSALVYRYGRETPLAHDYFHQYPPVPALKTSIHIEKYRGGHLTFGFVLDALRGLVQFKDAYPGKDGSMVAVIKIPFIISRRPIGHIGFYDEEDDSELEISAGK